MIFFNMYIKEKIKRSHTRVFLSLFFGYSLISRKTYFTYPASSPCHTNVTCYINKILNTSSDIDEINILSRTIYIYILIYLYMHNRVALSSKFSI